jgi:hypothetical protein
MARRRFKRQPSRALIACFFYVVTRYGNAAYANIPFYVDALTATIAQP